MLFDAEADLRAFTISTAARWLKLRDTERLERQRRDPSLPRLVGIFPNDAAALRLNRSVSIE